MKNFLFYFFLSILSIALFCFLAGCSDTKKQIRFATGNWVYSSDGIYIFLRIDDNGDWAAEISISDEQSTIVKAKKKANGIWNIENKKMVFVVLDSQAEEIWEKDKVVFYDILSLTSRRMKLLDEKENEFLWRASNNGIVKAIGSNAKPVLPMGIFVVNLNKHKSNMTSKYLCLHLDMNIKEIMPEKKVPLVHPKIHDAIISFYSSLTYNEVKDFDRIEKQNKRLVAILNPYIKNIIKGFVIKHAIITAHLEQVEQFIFENTIMREIQS